MEACWHQHLAKIDANFEQRFFEKTSFSLGKTMILKVQGIEVGGKKSMKNRSKNGVKMGRHFGIDF